jgi:hypothetical protein
MSSMKGSEAMFELSEGFGSNVRVLARVWKPYSSSVKGLKALIEFCEGFRGLN